MHYEGKNLKFWQFEEKKRGQYEKKCIMKGKCRDRTILSKRWGQCGEVSGFENNFMSFILGHRIELELAAKNSPFSLLSSIFFLQ